KLPVIGFKFGPGSVGNTGKNLTCDAALTTPLVSKKQIANMSFTSLSSTTAGDGEIYYGTAQKNKNDPSEIAVTFVLKYNSDHNVKEFFPNGTSIPEPPEFRYEVDRVLIRC